LRASSALASSDVFGADGHIGHNGDAVGRNLDETFADGQEIVASILTSDDFTATIWAISGTC